MASISAWVDANVAAGKKGQSSKVAGTMVSEFSQLYAKLGAADGNGSVLAFVLIPADAVLVDLKLLQDALTGFSSVSCGFYKLNADGLTFSDTAKSDGTSASAVLLALADLSAGFAVGSEKDMMASVTIANRGKKVWDLLGYTDPKNVDGSYVLALTAATAGTAAGNIHLRGRYIQG